MSDMPLQDIATELLSGCQEPVRAEFTLLLSRVLYTMPAETFNHDDFGSKQSLQLISLLTEFRKQPDSAYTLT